MLAVTCNSKTHCLALSALSETCVTTGFWRNGGLISLMVKSVPSTICTVSCVYILLCYPHQRKGDADVTEAERSYSFVRANHFQQDLTNVPQRIV